MGRASTRATCYVRREFGVISAKRGVYDSFTPIGIIQDELTGYIGRVIILTKGCPFSDHEVLKAYNAEGYPPVEAILVLPREDVKKIQRQGYAAYVADKIAGKRL